MSPAPTAAYLGFYSCHVCGLLRTSVPDPREVRCGRCGSLLHFRKPHCIARTWALLIASYILFVPANVLPIMHTSSLFGAQSDTDSDAALFHDDELDGPLPERTRTIALTLNAERAVVTARVAGLDGIDIVGAEDVPDVSDSPVQSGRPEQQLAMLAVRLEMAATYLRLVRG